MSRGLLLLAGCATLRLLPAGQVDLDDPDVLLAVAGLLLLVGIELRSFVRPRSMGVAASVPLHGRVLASGAGALAVTLAALGLRVLIERREPALFSEGRILSLGALPAEAAAVAVGGALAGLLLPAHRWAAEARDPIRALLGWTAPLPAAVALQWVALKATWTHVGDPSGWGRSLLLALAFGAGWSGVARRFASNTSGSTGGALRWRSADLYVVVLVLAMPPLLLIGAARWRPPMELAPLAGLALGLLADQAGAPRSGGVAELARAGLLALPCAAVGLLGLLVAREQALELAAPWLVAPPLLAVAGTAWLAGAGALVAARRASGA